MNIEPTSISGEITIPSNKVGIVRKTKGKPVKTLIACNGEAGIQADVLEPGWHFGKFSWMYEITLVDIIEIGSDEIGIVQAEDGVTPQGKFGKVVEYINLQEDELKKAQTFQDARAFLENGGEVGIQQTILRQGRYLINTELFKVSIDKITKIGSDEIGIVQAEDGATPQGKFGKVVEYINLQGDKLEKAQTFQDARAFFENGGEAGIQQTILRQGRYSINTELFKVSIDKITKIEPDKIGLVEALDGLPLEPGQLVAKEVICDNFQNSQKFFENGGQIGKQTVVLRGGNFQINTEIFKIEKREFTHVQKGKIGLVTAKAGKAKLPSQEFGIVVDCHNFQNAGKFLLQGGQVGKQQAILRPGIYQIHTDIFEIEEVDEVEIEPGKVGLVTAKYGEPLESGSFGRAIECNDFQDVEAFLNGHGQKGKQLAVLKPGNFQIHTDIFEVEIVDVVSIETGEVGLVTAKGGLPGAKFGKVVEYPHLTEEKLKKAQTFQDAEAFINGGGEKGKQLAYLKQGVYYINKYLFDVVPVEITTINPRQIALIEALDGKPLQSGKNFGQVVSCDDFQDAQTFINEGGQAGHQLAFLRTGNFTINTNFFKVTKIDLIEIPQDKLGIVEAVEGKSRPANRKFGQVVPCDHFQDAQAFLDNDGEKGIQQAVLEPGLYKINRRFFKIKLIPVTKIANNEIGLVIANDGTFLGNGQDLGKVVECDNFQNPQMFFEKGGQIGKQVDILREGEYYINSLLFTVTKENVTQISSNEIGIVEATAGVNRKPGKVFAEVVDCNDFQNAEVFLKNGGQIGKQIPILTAGNYYINTYLFEVKIVPVTEIAADEIGLIEAKEGANRPPGKTFAKVIQFNECDNLQDPVEFLNRGGERGLQLPILQQGTFYINTNFFKVRKDKVVTIAKDNIGLVIANDGEIMPRGQELGNVISEECKKFQSAELFLAQGGQKGKQLSFLTTGVHRINTNLFTVYTVDNIDQYNATVRDEELKLKPKDLQVTIIEDDQIGIVTAYAGKAMKTGDIAGSVIEGHENFQKAEKFIEKGGQKGLQEEIIPAGRWMLNPWFVKVKQVPMTIIPNGHVGVIKSDVGETPKDNAQLVERGYKGTWKTPLNDGKYTINTDVQKVVIIPINDLVLQWTNNDSDQKVEEQRTEKTKVYKKFPPLEVHDVNGFKVVVEVTQVIRITKENAPEVLCKVADEISSVDELIEEVFEPAVRSFFLDAVQQYEAQNFLKDRKDIQQRAKAYIEGALEQHNVLAINTYIGKIDIPDELTETSRKGKLAKEKEKQIILETQLKDKEKDFKIKEEEVNLAIQQAEEKNRAEIAKIQREEKQKEAEAKIQLDAQVHEAQIKRRHQKLEVDANARERINAIDIDSDRKRKENEATYKKAISELNTEQVNFLKALGEDKYLQLQLAKASQGTETAKAIAMIQAAMASQSLDNDKIRLFVEGLGNIQQPDNPQIVVGNDGLQAINSFSNPLGMLIGQLSGILGQSNPNSLSQLGMGQFLNSAQQNPNAKIDDSQVSTSLPQSNQSNSNLESSQLPKSTQLNSNSQSTDSIKPQFNPNQFENLLQTQPISTVQMAQPRCPLVLLLDSSKSMAGERINHLNEALVTFQQKIREDTDLSQYLDLALVTLNSHQHSLQPFVSAHQFNLPTLIARGDVVMGKGIELALNEIESYTKYSKSRKIKYRKPWLLLIMGGHPTDNLDSSALQCIKKDIENLEINFFIVGIQGTDMVGLRQIAPPNSKPEMLDGLKFKELFNWLSCALQKISSSQVNSTVKMPPATWKK